jgi:hypothetical protein
LISAGGTTAAYLRARLERSHPDITERPIIRIIVPARYVKRSISSVNPRFSRRSPWSMSAIISSSTRRQLPKGASRCRSFTILRPWTSSAASRVNHRFSVGNAAITVTPRRGHTGFTQKPDIAAVFLPQQSHLFGEAPSDPGIATIGEQFHKNGTLYVQYRKKLIKEGGDHWVPHRP